MRFRALRRAVVPLTVVLLATLHGCSNQPAQTPSDLGNAAAAGSAGGSSGGGGGTTAGASAIAGAAATSGAGGGAAGSTAAQAGSGGSGATPSWPNGAVAAVSLTYDDGLDSQLANVIPALDAHNFKATFFLSNFEGVDHQWALPNLKDPLTARHLAWQAVGKNGHELAGHTVNHPCNSATKAAGFHLTDYDMTRMSAELDDSLLRLARLGAQSPLTFAYPCESDKIGIGPTGQDYSPLIATRFFAARSSNVGIADPTRVDLQRVPLEDAGAQTADQLRAMVDQAIAAKGWLVVLFHGVGKDQTCPNLDFNLKGCMINYLTTATDAHQALVDYLALKQAQVWTAPFGTVAKTLTKKP